MVAVAILKNASWGVKNVISAPILVGENWVERPENERRVTIWENFAVREILDDFYSTMKEPLTKAGNK
jgi:hypothetical protein